MQQGFNQCSLVDFVKEEDCILNDGFWYKYFYQDSVDCVLNDGIWFKDGGDKCGVCGGEGAQDTGTCDCK